MRIAGTRIAAALVVLGLAACDESPVSLPEATSVTVPSAELRLVVGDMARLPAQVLDQRGQVMPDASPAFSSDNPSVAFVDASGTVRAVTPGTATVTAAYGGATAQSKVTVSRDERGFVKTLELLADSLAVDVRMGAQAVAVRAFNGFGQHVCPELRVSSSDASVATAMWGGCRVDVFPTFPGEATITVSANGVADSVRVRVTSTGALVFFSRRPAPSEVFAGNTVTYGVKMLDEGGRPIAGRTVNLDVSAGRLSAARAVTDTAGVATVQWTLPTDLAEMGRFHTLSVRAQLPNGSVATRGEELFVNAAALTSLVLYRYEWWNGTLAPLAEGAAVTAPIYSYVDIAASGTDRYGNAGVGAFTFSVTAPAYLACSSAGYHVRDDVRASCAYSSTPGRATFTVTAGSVSKSVNIDFTG